MKEIDCQSLSLETYEEFLKTKLSPFYNIIGRKIYVEDSQVTLEDIKDVSDLEPHLFDYQKFIVKLALKKQRYAIFADCGLGKTAMFLSWARHLNKQLNHKKILIISPLAVISQTLEEEKKFYNDCMIEDIHNKPIQEWIDDEKSLIAITNYDKFHKKINHNGKIGAVILDESSILKNETGKIRTSIIESFRDVQFKLCCTATPAPNDREEYANHSTFLNYTRSNNEFYSQFFINKDNGWEIKPHALEYFYKHLAQWSIYLNNPQNYNFNNNVKDIPSPEFIELKTEWTKEQNQYVKNFFVSDIMTKKHFYLKLSKGFIEKDNKISYIESNKIKQIKEIINNHNDSQIIIWVTYNQEDKILLKELEKKYSVKSISGETDEEKRAEIIKDFRNGKFKILISKAKLLGFGINLPFVDVQIFSGINDSYEQFYQCIKRSYRYGQKKSLKIYIPVTEIEKKILNNILSKKETYETDSLNQEKKFISFLKDEINLFNGGKIMETEVKNESNETNLIIDNDYSMYLGDSIKRLSELKENSIDLSIFSPPFSSLFTYSKEISDMGNSRDSIDEFNLHFEYFLDRLFKVMKEGRMTCCHVQQLANFKNLSGFVGTKDFRGKVIELFQKAGFIFFGEFVIAKNPQAQAIRNKVRSLSFAQLDRNRLGSRPAYNDFVLIFRKGLDYIDVVNDSDAPSREEWINWACGVWTDIKETDTLNTGTSKTEEDIKHVCPLQLEVIRRCIRLYSNKNEVVLDPFNGIGSTGVVALQLKRKYIGIELKKEYFEESIRNFKKLGMISHNKIENIRSIKNIDIYNDSLLNFNKGVSK